jgi:hypothetical protein
VLQRLSVDVLDLGFDDPLDSQVLLLAVRLVVGLTVERRKHLALARPAGIAGEKRNVQFAALVGLGQPLPVLLLLEELSFAVQNSVQFGLEEVGVGQVQFQPVLPALQVALLGQLAIEEGQRLKDAVGQGLAGPNPAGKPILKDKLLIHPLSAGRAELAEVVLLLALSLLLAALLPVFPLPLPLPLLLPLPAPVPFALLGFVLLHLFPLLPAFGLSHLRMQLFEEKL